MDSLESILEQVNSPSWTRQENSHQLSKAKGWHNDGWPDGFTTKRITRPQTVEHSSQA